ncbi:MAG: hypothetical protein SAMD01599839_01310 [Rectinema sp.]
MTTSTDAFMQQPIPLWMSSKVARLTAYYQKATGSSSLAETLGELEFQSATILRAELVAFPDLTVFVPEDFLRLLQQNALGAMKPLECAALVIIEADAQACSSATNPDDLAEFTRLKWQSFGSLLQEAENV